MDRMVEAQDTTRKARLVDRFTFVGAVLLLILTAVNLVLSRANDAISAELVRGQQEINEGLRLGRINAELIRTIAALSANADDRDLRLLLARHGITFSIRQDVSSNTAKADFGGSEGD